MSKLVKPDIRHVLGYVLIRVAINRAGIHAIHSWRGVGRARVEAWSVYTIWTTDGTTTFLNEVADAFARSYEHNHEY